MKKSGQYLAAIAVSLGGFCTGTSLAWSSPALEYLMPPQNTSEPSSSSILSLSLTEEATVGAMLPLGALMFAIPSGKLADLWGRKSVLQLLSVLCTLSWIIIGCAWNAVILMIGRFVAGMAMGGCCVVCPMYVGEIADEENRGLLGSLFSILLGLGIVYTSVIGTFTNWMGLNIGLGISSIVFGLSLLFIPETPIYLIRNGKLDSAKKSLIFLRNDRGLANDELTSLQGEKSPKSEVFVDLFRKSIYRKSLVAGAGVFFLQQCCGINVIVFYTVPIFKVSGVFLSPSVASISVNTFAVICGIISMSIINKKGRKFFLIFSSCCLFIGMFGLGVFFQLNQSFTVSRILQFLPILSMLIFMGGFSFGYGPVPWILISELYPVEVRGIASGLMSLINWFACFMVTFTYPILMKYIGSYMTFYLYGTINFLGFLFILFVVPETKNRRIKQ